jgi:heat shock protein HslJ
MTLFDMINKRRMMKMNRTLLVIFAVILIATTACSIIGQDAAPETDFDGDIRGITWMWERFDDTADLNNIVVDDPSLYTLTLNVDGTYSVKADCNMASGAYVLEGSSLKFEPGPTTLAECGPESLYNTFLADLGYVATYVIEGNTLYLNLWADGGNMVFSPVE